MKCSISADRISTGKSPKLVHCSPDRGISHRLPFTKSYEHLSCLPVSMEREPPATSPVRPPQDSKLSDAWALLRPAINTIFDDAYKAGDPPIFCCNTIFDAVKLGCFWNPGHVQLIFDLVKECEPHIAATILSLEKQSSEDPSVFLPLVYDRWLVFKKKMMFVSDLAMYQRCNGITLWDVGRNVCDWFYRVSFRIKRSGMTRRNKADLSMHGGSFTYF